MGIGFAMPMLMIYHNSGGLGSFLLRLFLIMPCFICIYSLIVYQVINQSFRLITDIPNGVFKWIGVQAQLGGSAFNPTEAARGFEQGSAGGMARAQSAGERAYGSMTQRRQKKLDAEGAKGSDDKDTTIGGSG